MGRICRFASLGDDFTFCDLYEVFWKCPSIHLGDHSAGAALHIHIVAKYHRCVLLHWFTWILVDKSKKKRAALLCCMVLWFGSWDLHFQHLWAPRGHGRIYLCCAQLESKSGKICEDVGMHNTIVFPHNFWLKTVQVYWIWFITVFFKVSKI